MLREGGNAVDAILAAAITLTVVEPCNNGIGSDAFAQVFDSDQLHGYAGSGRSPHAWDPSRFAHYDTMPIHGWDAVTVPGAVRTWVDLHTRFGKAPFQDVFRDAISYAEHGFHVGHKTASLWQRSVATFSDFAPFLRHFSIDGRAPSAGERFERPELAETLRDISATRGASFYSGGLAQAIVKQSEREGGCMSLDDLSSHTGVWQKPISIDYHDVKLHEMPPSGQGLAALIALGILKTHTIS